MNPREQFPRTVCNCDKCKAHCRHCPGHLIPVDLDNIADHLDLTPQELADGFLLASPGALVATNVDGVLHVHRIPTLVPAVDDAGWCVFLGDIGCGIHAVSPFGCSHFDYHMPKEEADKRSQFGLRLIAQSPEYRKIWQRLWDAGERSEAPEKKRTEYA